LGPLLDEERHLLTGLLTLLTAAAVLYAIVMVRTALARRALTPRGEAVLIGAVTNFLDTLGISSFATILAWLKLRTSLAPRLIPCTMIVACTIPTIVQSVIFLVLLGVHVDPMLLVGYALALLAGGLIGARLVSRVPVWIVQGIVGVALLIAAALYALSNLHMMPPGGLAASLPLPLMAVVFTAALMMGVLINFGVGHYAPSMMILSLMGLDPRLAFPIMATAGALTVAVVGARHIRTGIADIRIALGLTLGGVPAILLAALIVKTMPLEALRWLIIAVVTYTATVMLREAARAFRTGPLQGDGVALAVAEGLTD
jgi:uncharacterized membrane protein YfcA